MIVQILVIDKLGRVAFNDLNVDADSVEERQQTRQNSEKENQ